MGRGLGAAIVHRFLDVIVFRDPDVIACLADPEEDNRMSWRMFEKAGF